MLQTGRVTELPAVTAYVEGRFLEGSVYNAARTKPSGAVCREVTSWPASHQTGRHGPLIY
jgi:hypothetical protein